MAVRIQTTAIIATKITKTGTAATEMLRRLRLCPIADKKFPAGE